MSGDRPTISLIWAMAENRVIGRNNQLPWHLSADLQHFKRLTLGKPIVMGRKTWESLPGLLPKRQHIVVTGNRDYRAEGALVVHSIDEAVAAAGDAQEIMIVGGGAFYAQMLPRADRLYLTLVHTEVEGDAWFPEFDLSVWREVGREDFSADEKNCFAYSFVTLEREN
ncbi:MAG: type 3 dihydrofolate reductase [Chromatiales bacterium]|uniref:type 3 dihydrofolate reductase n=1 Tax=endosymbiont of Lamellibrachia barhami TaxID=205975 RepID=UPI0015ABF7B0|nr:type 3 dihydrofolate reductase [endosymbiont of Lamellibrachia barhami]MBA1444576.1 type 3 dihydrofolate reductase [Gammaproteobacteria bacterium]